MWRFRQGAPPLEFGREESVALEDGDAIALGTGVGDALATAEEKFRLSELCSPNPRFLGVEDKVEEQLMPQARLLPALGGREPHFGLDDEDGFEPHWTSAARKKVVDPARSRSHRGWT
ncbi:unnamed protein product [Symbiodinium pilosum]|uniref:Uncharacterized protein n=1 Tax=Symbiodinium pilosum TaxID=2952 RepID=A0A812MFX9_SYMPI|nr:unnamed protein product [Symbiodinium pilosum]